MRTLFILIFFSVCAVPASAETEKLVSREWESLSEQRRLYYVFGMREKYQEEGAVFTIPAGDYPALVTRTLRKRPDLLDESLDAAFAVAVAANEPSSARLKKN